MNCGFWCDDDEDGANSGDGGDDDDGERVLSGECGLLSVWLHILSIPGWVVFTPTDCEGCLF